MSNKLNDQLAEELYDIAYDYYWHEGYRGDLLDELIMQEVESQLKDSK